GRAADGRGTSMNGAFQALGQSSADLSTTTTVLHNRADDLAGLITASERLDADLQRAPIDRQIRDTDLVLSGLVQVEDAIGSGIGSPTSQVPPVQDQDLVALFLGN